MNLVTALNVVAIYTQGSVLSCWFLLAQIRYRQLRRCHRGVRAMWKVPAHKQVTGQGARCSLSASMQGTALPWDCCQGPGWHNSSLPDRAGWAITDRANPASGKIFSCSVQGNVCWRMPEAPGVPGALQSSQGFQKCCNTWCIRALFEALKLITSFGALLLLPAKAMGGKLA